VEVLVLRGRKGCPTKYYLGFKDGKFAASLSAQELDRVVREELVTRAKGFAYCSKHGEILDIGYIASFFVRSAKRASDCHEMCFLNVCWFANPELGEAFVSGDLGRAADIIINRMPDERIKLLNVVEVLVRLRNVSAYSALLDRIHRAYEK